MSNQETSFGGSSLEPMPAWLEEAWMLRYLDRELSDSESNWFESYCLTREHLLQRIESDADLRDALNASDHQLPESQPTKQSKENSRWLWQSGAAAACLALGILVGRGLSPAADSEVSFSPQPNITRLMFDTARGSALAVRVDHPDSTSALVLLDVALPSAAENVTMQLGDKQILGLKVSSDGFASVLVQRQMLSARPLVVRYTVRDTEVERVLETPQN